MSELHTIRFTVPGDNTINRQKLISTAMRDVIGVTGGMRFEKGDARTTVTVFIPHQVREQLNLILRCMHDMGWGNATVQTHTLHKELAPEDAGDTVSRIPETVDATTPPPVAVDEKIPQFAEEEVVTV